MTADKDALLREVLGKVEHEGYCIRNYGARKKCDCGLGDLLERITAALAERDDGWIKCSERLPTDREEYLVAFQMGDHVYCRPELLNPAMTGFYVTCNEGDGSPAETAIAWRPLPPLPKGDE